MPAAIPLKPLSEIKRDDRSIIRFISWSVSSVCGFSAFIKKHFVIQSKYGKPVIPNLFYRHQGIFFTYSSSTACFLNLQADESMESVHLFAVSFITRHVCFFTEKNTCRGCKRFP